MNFQDLIIEALGLQDICIESFKADKSNLRLDIYARQVKEKCFCEKCGTILMNVHDWRERTLRASPVGAFREVWIYLKRLRAICDGCQGLVRLSKLKGVHPWFENLTCALAETAGRMMEEITCQATARLLRLNPKTLWNLDQWRMRQMLKRHKIPKDLDTAFMSADEVHFKTKWYKGQRHWDKPPWEAKFITNLVCYKSSKVVWNAPGRSETSLENCLNKLTEPQRLGVAFFAVDLHDPFIKVIHKYCPQASICVDRFHLVQLTNKAFDEVRRAEFNRAKQSKDEFLIEALAPRRRFILVEREKRLAGFDLKLLEHLRAVNKNIQNAMLLLDYFHAVLDAKTVEKFRKNLTLWYRLVRESKLEPFRKLARTIRKYRLNIENFIRSRLTTAVSEGLNNKIKVLKRMGYGYQNEKSFRLKILQRCGYLNSTHIDTTEWHWHIPNHQ